VAGKSATTRPPTGTDRPGLSKAAVVERGLALADAEGLEAVTIRRLAAGLGVTPMALYWHFRNKEELLTELADAVWAELEVRVDPRADWPDQLRRLLESLVQVLRGHPSASRLLVGSEKRMGQAAMVASETTLEVLQHGGFDLEYSTAIMRNTLFTGVMLAMSEPGFEPGIPEAPRTDPDFHYQLGIDMFIAGVQALSQRTTADHARDATS
jgi:TetR/AcrR family transcriptional regulator, tetracycline repressor protein